MIKLIQAYVCNFRNLYFEKLTKNTKKKLIKIINIIRCTFVKKSIEFYVKKSTKPNIYNLSYNTKTN